MVALDPGFFRLNATWVLARYGRRVFRDIVGYMRRNRKRNSRTRTPIEATKDYMTRDGGLGEAAADVVFHTFRDRGSGLTSEELWLAVDHANRRKDGKYKRHAGRMPRLGSFITASLPYGCTLESAIDAVEAFLDFLEEEFCVAAEAVIHDKGDGPDHAHILMTDRFVDRNGVGAKNRDLNAIAAKAAGLGIVDGDTVVAPAMESMRSRWAGLIRAIAPPGSRPIDHRSFARRGIDLEPCVSVSHKEILVQQLEGDEWWRRRRARGLALRKSKSSKIPAAKAHAVADTADKPGAVMSLEVPTVCLADSTVEPDPSPSIAAAIATPSATEIATSILARLKAQTPSALSKRPYKLFMPLPVRAAADWLIQTASARDEHGKAASVASTIPSFVPGRIVHEDMVHVATSLDKASPAASMTTATATTDVPHRAEPKRPQPRAPMIDRVLQRSGRFKGPMGISPLPALSKFLIDTRSGSSAAALQLGLGSPTVPEQSAKLFERLRTELRRHRRHHPEKLLMLALRAIGFGREDATSVEGEHLVASAVAARSTASRLDRPASSQMDAGAKRKLDSELVAARTDIEDTPQDSASAPASQIILPKNSRSMAHLVSGRRPASEDEARRQAIQYVQKKAMAVRADAAAAQMPPTAGVLSEQVEKPLGALQVGKDRARSPVPLADPPTNVAENATPQAVGPDPAFGHTAKTTADHVLPMSSSKLAAYLVRQDAANCPTTTSAVSFGPPTTSNNGPIERSVAPDQGIAQATAQHAERKASGAPQKIEPRSSDKLRAKAKRPIAVASAPLHLFILEEGSAVAKMPMLSAPRETDTRSNKPRADGGAAIANGLRRDSETVVKVTLTVTDRYPPSIPPTVAAPDVTLPRKTTANPTPRRKGTDCDNATESGSTQDLAATEYPALEAKGLIEAAKDLSPAKGPGVPASTAKSLRTLAVTFAAAVYADHKWDDHFAEILADTEASDLPKDFKAALLKRHARLFSQAGLDRITPREAKKAVRAKTTEVGAERLLASFDRIEEAIRQKRRNTKATKLLSGKIKGRDGGRG